MCAPADVLDGFPRGQQVVILRTTSRFIRGISDQSDINDPPQRPTTFQLTGPNAMTRFLELLSRIVYGAIAIILLLLALVLACDAVFQFGRQLLVGGEVTEAALAGIGYVVVSIATFEIARYLTEEEVVRGRGRESLIASKARRSLTRLVSTVAVAIFLEALVIVFHVGKENVPQLIYPTFLLIAAIMIVVGLGFYQRLSAGVEEHIEEVDIATNNDRLMPERSEQ
jgi:hypothetical protein